MRHAMVKDNQRSGWLERMKQYPDPVPFPLPALRTLVIYYPAIISLFKPSCLRKRIDRAVLYRPSQSFRYKLSIREPISLMDTSHTATTHGTPRKNECDWIQSF
ncbi:hypothetical protein BDR05DRAFT_968540 [Suillus weaverae]|nr:hypothetical protein BDR05DRAFT_968540 [Suillus weaverae]